MNKKKINKMTGNTMDKKKSQDILYKLKDSPSRWKTPEFYFYYFMFALNIPLMFRCAIKFSSRNFFLFVKKKKIKNYILYIKI